VDIFRNPNYNIIGRKKIFLGISAVMLVVALSSILFGNGIPLGVDFKGGTLVYVKMADRPNEDTLRAAMQKAGLENARIQRYGPAENNEVLIALEGGATSEEALERGKNQIIRALQADLPEGKRDLNTVGTATLQEFLLNRDPLRAGTDAGQRYLQIAQQITEYRDRERGGLLRSFDELRKLVPPQVVSALEQEFVISKLTVRNVEIVGPQVGSQLRRQAILASLYSLAGMLIYLSLRFEVIYGAAAVLAVFHDVLITLGVFSLLKEEISLTVIASLLTLIGYSMNDKIVIFDRVRENLKLWRREPIGDLVNKSINQTLNRTMLTAGPTFLTLLAVLLFGGEVLQSFALALVVGIAVGTYSSFGFAAPLLVLYRERREAKVSPRGADERAEVARAKARR
jgi:preprotein translocase subunit SecF